MVGRPTPRKLGHADSPDPECSNFPGFQGTRCRCPRRPSGGLNSLCQFVQESPPRTYRLWGILHPANVFHWRVQAHLVYRLSRALRRAYRGLFSDETIAGHPLSHYELRQIVASPGPAPTVREVVVGHLAASNAEDATPPGSLLDQSDNPPEDDEVSHTWDAYQTGEVSIPDPSESSLVPWEPWRPGAEASFAPNPEYPLPPPGALTGGGVRFCGDATGLSWSPQSTYPDPPGVVG